MLPPFALPSQLVLQNCYPGLHDLSNELGLLVLHVDPLFKRYPPPLPLSPPFPSFPFLFFELALEAPGNTLGMST